jgi:parvulin-like peptidyl-prolyl isomerase
MKYFSSVIKIGLAVFLLTGTSGFASEKDLPVVEGKKAVATINGEPVTLEQFNQELSVLSGGKGENEKGVKEKKFELLKRLVNTRLIIQEARRMGLDELKELKERVDVFSRVALRDELMERQIKNIKPDEKEVEKIYRESVKEFKVRSILFEKEEDARRMEKTVREGKDFDETARIFVADKRGKVDGEGNYLKRRDLLPEIKEAVSRMKIGSVSPVVRIRSGFVIFKLEDIRFPDDPLVKERVRLEVLREKQREAFGKYDKTLRTKYVKVNEVLLESLDFDSKEPGFEKLMKDKRVVAQIKGEKPITVGELADYMRQQLFHGVDRAAEAKRLNKRKNQMLEEMLHKRVLRKEALRLGIDKTEDYKNKVKEYENSLVFGTFIQKVVVPDVKLKEEELKAHYDQHIKDYTYPEMMRMSTLVFERREDAEKTILTLRKGTEFQWVKANAEGQLDRTTRGILDLDGKLLTTRDLPEELKKAISGAKAGDFRLYQSSENHFYVLSIQQVVPSRPQPYEEAREKVAQKVYDDKLKKAVEDYADKLRALSDVKVYLED